MEFRKPVLMLISLFIVLIALADGDYIMMMISLMTLYNMGGGEWEIPLLWCPAHSSIQNMQVLEYIDHHLFSLLLILLSIYRLYTVQCTV
jgi:hypothetical protein